MYSAAKAKKQGGSAPLYRVLFVFVLCLCAITFCRAFLLDGFCAYKVEGNFRYAALEPILLYGSFILSHLTVMIGYGLNVRAVLSFGGKKALPIVLTVLASSLLSYLGSCFVTLLTTSILLSDLPLLLLYAFLSFLLEALLHGILFFIALRMRRKQIPEPDNPEDELPIPRMVSFLPFSSLLSRLFAVSSLCYALYQLLFDVITDIQLLITYGAPLNLSEWLTLLSPLPEALLRLLIAYCVMTLVSLWQDALAFPHSSKEVSAS